MALSYGEWALALQPLLQRLALEQGHDIEREPVGLAGVEESEDVGMLQACGGPNLVEEGIPPDDICELRLGELGAH